MKLGFLYSDEFGERVMGNLMNYSIFCRACDVTCEHCRASYGSYASDIYWLHEVPKDLPTFIDDPSQYLPRELPELDILLVIGVHPDILSTIPDMVSSSTIKAVIVPIECKDWCPPGLRRQLTERFEEIGVEAAFPKPFCSFTLSGKRYLDAFIERYRVGRPILEVDIDGGVVKRATVVRSAPCGATWFISRQILNKRIVEIEEAVSKAHHAYPCTGSMQVDPEIGDTILHKAGYMAREAVKDAIVRSGYRGELRVDDRMIQVKTWTTLIPEVQVLLEVFPAFEDVNDMIERILWTTTGELHNPSRYTLKLKRHGVEKVLSSNSELRLLEHEDKLIVEEAP
ncbi:MAG: thymidylate synthase [Thermoprotei archaeon]|nr:MAG: thymidylate synthase [Thermoprotei archaeon]